MRAVIDYGVVITTNAMHSRNDISVSNKSLTAVRCLLATKNGFKFSGSLKRYFGK
ncbi:MAG: hypothetical protein IKG79_06820 [Neisseriaceae bacterium]|nr:hypothetical protein [Neisseriaceae bacterium]